ncbi:MAG TPA: hypothetical protein VJQ84_05845, partial [Solirubrobacterales bacterium]|nr:hypothetical protein [Solirubrobacterales bacterium]
GRSPAGELVVAHRRRVTVTFSFSAPSLEGFPTTFRQTETWKRKKLVDLGTRLRPRLRVGKGDSLFIRKVS